MHKGVYIHFRWFSYLFLLSFYGDKICTVPSRSNFLSHLILQLAGHLKRKQGFIKTPHRNCPRKMSYQLNRIIISDSEIGEIVGQRLHRMLDNICKKTGTILMLFSKDKNIIQVLNGWAAKQHICSLQLLRSGVKLLSPASCKEL